MKGQTQSFSATVQGNNSPSQTVSWSVEGGVTGTAITGEGVLTVADNETAASLTARATSAFDTSKSGTAAVTVTEVTDGTYVNQNNSNYKITITGYSWVSYRNNTNYGKGTYTLGENNDILAHSTHAWNPFSETWEEYTMDIIFGSYDILTNSFILEAAGWDSNFTGTYKRQ
jgi:hypothetical protein